METQKHIPVLLDETIESLGVRAGGRYIDATLGRAGHAKAILARGGKVLGIDRDEEAIAETSAMRLDGLEIAKGNHGEIAKIARERGWENVDGILLDLGVSSPQLDEAGRGFSFMREGSLDMRMDRSSGLAAADIVNGWSEEELERIFRTLGEEPRARAIVRIIARRRLHKPFETTMELATAIEREFPRRGSAKHPATRVFQALRMAVNDETGELERALAGGIGLLAPGGRFAVITFESLTDRMVKRFFAGHVGRMESLQQGGAKWRGTLPRARAVTKKPIVAGKEETDLNPRSRSAKLRAIEISKEEAR